MSIDVMFLHAYIGTFVISENCYCTCGHSASRQSVPLHSILFNPTTPAFFLATLFLTIPVPIQLSLESPNWSSFQLCRLQVFGSFSNEQSSHFYAHYLESAAQVLESLANEEKGHLPYLNLPSIKSPLILSPNLHNL